MSRARAHARAWPAVVLALALGCAAQHEDPTGASPDSERARAADQELPDAGAEAAPMEPATEAEKQAELSLEQVQRELASNEARLRELGVELPSTKLEQDAASGDANVGSKTNGRTESAKPPSGGGGGAAGAPVPKPGKQPSAEPDGLGGLVKGGGTKPKQSRRDKDSKKKSEDLDDRFAQPPPDELKASPLPDGDTPKQDAAGRCQQICELTQVTCELNVQICELADRHPDEDDYQAACTRAAEDCDAAQEACHECAG